MKAVRFDLSIPRYLVGKALGSFYPSVFWNGLSCTVARDIDPPALPTPEWVRVRTRLGGICGTDTGTISLSPSLYFTPFISERYTFGHENVGTIQELGANAPAEWKVGDRVIVDPLLWCGPRGLDRYCEYCSRGEINRCQRITEGDVAPGIMTGLCESTGGSWSESFVAHPLQLYRVPDSVSDENALMVEPLSTGLHAALTRWPEDHETVLIIGAGTMGLCTLSALRGLGSRARILVLARYDFQVEAARRLGADKVFNGHDPDIIDWIIQQAGGQRRQPIIGKPFISGGVNHTIECVGTDSAIDQAMRLTRDGGTVVLAGIPGTKKNVDWGAIFGQELTVMASRNYHHVETWNGRTWKAPELVLHLIESGKIDLSWMITHRYRIDDYKKALTDSNQRRRSKMLKGIFEFQGS